MTLARRALRGLSLPLLTIALAHPVLALDLAWPDGAERVVSRGAATAGFAVATGRYAEGTVPTRQAEGDLVEEVWQVPGEMGDAALLYGLLTEQLAAQGYTVTFSCADTACGGFDFRFALPIAEGPAMHVDLGRFHYLAATRQTGAGPEHLALTVSQGGMRGYAHLARVLPAETLPATVIPSTRVAGDPADPGLIARLTASGYAVLEDLTFGTGASELSGRRYESLVSLADWLAEDTGRRIVLVGHTDAEGALESNIALSRARAAAVREALVSEFGADPARIEAAGVGYLAPRAANSEATGREANRRVEVVLVAQ